MKHFKDPEDPQQPMNGTLNDPDCDLARSHLSNCPHSIQNNNSSGSHRHSPTRKNKSSSRTALNRILRAAGSQQNGSAPGTTLASADGSAETLVNHQVIPVGTTSGANSPPSNTAAQLNRITILHQEAATQFNRII